MRAEDSNLIYFSLTAIEHLTKNKASRVSPKNDRPQMGSRKKSGSTFMGISETTFYYPQMTTKNCFSAKRCLRITENKVIFRAACKSHLFFQAHKINFFQAEINI